ncbi:hypothetical protein SKAU_G00026450 [Synaphobranchus kaupii]|uniref:PiggyBac transposable element-derived protein domain-containing protein n=1 Tax=Synaphobranchus kaupii TaxID=118154 RepID=A0A9Q1JF13_SYNKA|nr:hypothetical protein SKAU_G00026450 [Synaphobranchus kaupii]
MATPWTFACTRAKQSSLQALDLHLTLMKPVYLGTGYNLYVDNFYTSPKLFKHLYALNIAACGTYRDNGKECPRAQSNAMTRKEPRDGPLLFVKWMDTREVSVCSTIHAAFSGHTVQRRAKNSWTAKSIPCPTPIVEYNQHMGGVELSDQLIQYYSVHHKTMRWYRALFYHFMDIAATNSFHLHKELRQEKQDVRTTHRAFVKELTAQLCGVTAKIPPRRAQHGHIPVPISPQEDPSKKATQGRRTCEHCKKQEKATSQPPSSAKNAMWLSASSWTEIALRCGTAKF